MHLTRDLISYKAHALHLSEHHGYTFQLDSKKVDGKNKVSLDVYLMDEHILHLDDKDNFGLRRFYPTYIAELFNAQSSVFEHIRIKINDREQILNCRDDICHTAHLSDSDFLLHQEVSHSVRIGEFVFGLRNLPSASLLNKKRKYYKRLKFVFESSDAKRCLQWILKLVFGKFLAHNELVLLPLLDAVQALTGNLFLSDDRMSACIFRLKQTRSVIDNIRTAVKPDTSSSLEQMEHLLDKSCESAIRAKGLKRDLSELAKQVPDLRQVLLNRWEGVVSQIDKKRTSDLLSSKPKYSITAWWYNEGYYYNIGMRQLLQTLQNIFTSNADKCTFKNKLWIRRGNVDELHDCPIEASNPTLSSLGRVFTGSKEHHDDRSRVCDRGFRVSAGWKTPVLHSEQR